MKLSRCGLSVALVITPLLLNGCSPASQLTSDAKDGDVAAVKADLGKAPVDASVGGWTALEFAAANGRLQVVQVLLAAGAKVDASDNKWGTPLCVAAGKSA